MVRVGSYEAKTHLPRLLKRVADGEHIIITKHGKPVAKLVPVEEKTELSVEEAIQEMKNFRIERPFTRDEILELIKEGRRY